MMEAHLHKQYIFIIERLENTKEYTESNKSLK